MGKSREGGNPQLLLNQRPTSNRSSISNKNPKFESLSVKTELFLSEKQNCLKAATQSSLGLNDSSSNTEKTLHGYKNIYTDNGHMDLCPTAPSRGCAKGQWHLHHQEQECCCESYSHEVAGGWQCLLTLTCMMALKVSRVALAPPHWSPAHLPQPISRGPECPEQLTTSQNPAGKAYLETGGCRAQGIRILGDPLAEGKVGTALFPMCLKTWFVLCFGDNPGMAARHCDSDALERDSGF